MRRSDGPSRGRCATLAGRRRCGGGSGTPFLAARPPHHGNVAVCAPERARGYGAGRRAWSRCVAERATAIKARVLHARAWNSTLATVNVLHDKSDPITCELLVSREIEGIWLALAYGYRCGDRQTESHPVQIWRWLWLNAPDMAQWFPHRRLRMSRHPRSYCCLPNFGRCRRCQEG